MISQNRSDANTVGADADIADLDSLYSKTNLELLEEIERLHSPAPGEYIDVDRINLILRLIEERTPPLEEHHYDAAAQWKKLKEDNAFPFGDNDDRETVHPS